MESILRSCDAWA